MRNLDNYHWTIPCNYGYNCVYNDKKILEKEIHLEHTFINKLLGNRFRAWWSEKEINCVFRLHLLHKYIAL